MWDILGVGFYQNLFWYFPNEQPTKTFIFFRLVFVTMLFYILRGRCEGWVQLIKTLDVTLNYALWYSQFSYVLYRFVYYMRIVLQLYVNKFKLSPETEFTKNKRIKFVDFFFFFLIQYMYVLLLCGQHIFILLELSIYKYSLKFHYFTKSREIICALFGRRHAQLLFNICVPRRKTQNILRTAVVSDFQSFDNHNIRCTQYVYTRIIIISF